MKRLIDDESRPGSPESFLAELVRATPPFEPAPRERQRVFALVAAGGAPRVRGLSVRIGSAALLLSSAAAAAVIGHSWTASHRATPTVAPLGASNGAVAPAVHASEVSADSVVPVNEAPASNSKGSMEPPSVKLRSISRAGSKALLKEGEDPAPVLEAIRALRNDGDAVRAGALLADYLRAHPHSVLSEDALALSIEGAMARHDARSAAEFGRRYLAQFPNGRYRAFALRAVQP